MRHFFTALNGLAFFWVGAATLYLLVASGYDGADASLALSGHEDLVGRLRVSLASAEGVWIVALLLVVTVVAGLPLGVSLAQHESHRLVAFVTGSLLLGFSVIAGFSVGLMYLPPALVLLASAATARVQGRRAEADDPHRDRG